MTMNLLITLPYIVNALPASPTENSALHENTEVMSGLVLLGIVVFWLVVATVFLTVMFRVLRRASPSGKKMTSPKNEQDQPPLDPWVEAAHRVDNHADREPLD
ncbi:MAG: hypothetical protein P8J86_08815 [Phycisphaerales bacterium]|nr:hypothetical protein [Phycisphaerales bacterium]